jgi:uncharacterized protein
VNRDRTSSRFPFPVSRFPFHVSRISTMLPHPEALLREIRLHSTHLDSLFHGVDHWQRVAWIGSQLAREVPGCDTAVVYLFSLFHDSMRVSDGSDPEHGRRGGLLARQLHGRCYEISPSQLDLLVAACEAHADGRVTRDPTIGVCWDADRLDLWRVGMRPDPRWLSTDAAQLPGRIRWSEKVRLQVPAWDDIYACFRSTFQSP